MSVINDQSPRLVLPKLADFYAVMQPLTYAVLRAGVGIALFTHGWPKITHTAHGRTADPLAATAGLVKNFLHLPYPEFWAYFIGYLETIGGIALACGFLTRFLAPAFAIQLGIITCIVWFLGGFVWNNPGAEYPFVLGLVLLYISFAGGGRFSVDRLIGKEL